MSTSRLRRPVAMPESDLRTMPVTAHGVVVHGEHLGRELGFPTANVMVRDTTSLPADGVYAARFHRHGGVTHSAVASLGMRPTVATNGHRALEAHLLDVNGWIDVYGEDASVSFVCWIRGQERFDGMQALIAQIREDCVHARTMLADTAQPANHIGRATFGDAEHRP